MHKIVGDEGDDKTPPTDGKFQHRAIDHPASGVPVVDDFALRHVVFADRRVKPANRKFGSGKAFHEIPTK